MSSPPSFMMGGSRSRFAGIRGYFYPQHADGLRDDLARLVPRRDGVWSRGAIVPHASYRFSGPVAGDTFGQLVIPRCCIIVGSSHLDHGPGWSLRIDGAYETPLGQIPVDVTAAEALRRSCELLEVDEASHQGEHSIEVQLPFLQWLRPGELAVVPIIGRSDVAEECERIADALAAVIGAMREPALLIASSDLTHYEPMDVARRKDARLIDAIQRLDERELIRRVGELDVQMCGVGPVACVVSALKRLGAAEGRLVRYATSADAGGDPGSAVGYAGMILN